MSKTAAVFNKKKFIEEVTETVRHLYRKQLKEASQQEIFQAVSYVVKDVIIDDWLATQQAFDDQDPKIVYYMSMEFLMGRALGNNLINLKVYKEVKEALEEIGLNLDVIEDQEPDPALGNGGLGRLAACFMESLATLGYAAYGCGIRYRYGMFKQQISDGFQVEVPDNWLKNGYPFELRRPEYSYEIKFGGYVRTEDMGNGNTKFVHEGYQSVMAIPYDMPIVGYNNHMVNTLMIWDAEPKEGFQLDSFDKGDYNKAVEQENLARNLVEVLYPNDNHIQGKELRLKQQYFFVSASLQRAIARFKKHHDDIHMLPEKAVFQMNDTHPTVAVAELMRILVDEEGLGWDEAWDITTHCVAYTNHTIMAEALEKWPIEIFQRLLPRVYQIVEEINRRFILQIQEQYPGNNDKIAKMAILYDGQVKMAHLAIVAGYSVNGVAKLHTEILKKEQLKDFYEMMPQKFNNKTNGITQRRFLAHANPLLADWVTAHVGEGWITDLSQIGKLAAYAGDKKAQQEFMDIKYQNKVRLAKYIKEHNGIDVDPRSIFDVQVKRLHEYKRQQMNALYAIYKYMDIKSGNKPKTPITMVFGAKAAPAYIIAKDIIHLILCLQELIDNDPEVSPYFKVIMLENYNVSKAAKVIPAADISEQISLASKEASGTGNMKFMLNGALTLGTMDGANVEIVEEVGKENAFIFGLSADQVIEYENNYTYDPMSYFIHDQDIHNVVMDLISGRYSNGDTMMFRDLYDSLLTPKNAPRPDMYFTLADFKSYAAAQERVEDKYRNTSAWARSAILNTAHSGKFTSDRTIQQYVDDIWHLDKITVRK